MQTVNIFWKGDNFTLINRISVLSHLIAGHKVIMWLAGNIPWSVYWIDDVEEIEIRDACEIFDVEGFMAKGGNVKTASDLWSFTFLRDRGGLYTDADAYAIKEFPDDPWILVSCNKRAKSEKLSIGVIKAPAGEQLFTNCINNIKKSWGNVTVFGDEYEKLNGHSDSSHDDKQFYPWTWRRWETVLQDIEIPNTYAIHFYHTMFEKNNMIHGYNWYKENHPDSMLMRLINRVVEKYPVK